MAGLEKAKSPSSLSESFKGKNESLGEIEKKLDSKTKAVVGGASRTQPAQGESQQNAPKSGGRRRGKRRGGKGAEKQQKQEYQKTEKPVEDKQQSSELVEKSEKQQKVDSLKGGKSKGEKQSKPNKQAVEKEPKDKQPSGKIASAPGLPEEGGEPGKEQPQKSKAELKAERRAKQEAQRAAKAAKQEAAGLKPKGSTEGHRPTPVAAHLQADDEKVQKKIAKKLAKQQVPQRTTPQKKVGLFSHLHQYEKDSSLTQEISLGCAGNIHPAIIKLGLQYARGIVCGSNARCVALLLAFKKVIADYSTPPHKELCRDLEAKIKPNISFLTQCRPLSVSMGNAIKHLKWQITHTPPDLPESKAKKDLICSLDNFIKEKIFLAGEAISKTYARKKINDGDIILTYAFSSLILKVLKDAHEDGKKFRVIVVDSRPKFEGKECLQRLVKHGIRCSYVLISAVSYVLKEVSKVFLGAHALLANGYVKARVGSSMIAMMANAYNVPVLVCCETYKFCDKVQTDSFVSNELGDPDDLVPLARYSQSDLLTDWRDISALNLLNLVYDVTPSHFVSMVITEVSKVFLGAHALLANGYVKSRVGSSMIAMMANAYNVPVLVCCETYKFCDKVQTDSFVSNELGDPDDLVPLARYSQSDLLTDWRDISALNLLNLVYDVTPSHFVYMVITEVGMIPCTSVPVVLRVQNPET